MGHMQQTEKLTTRMAAEKLGVSVRTVERHVAMARLTADRALASGRLDADRAGELLAVLGTVPR